MLSAQCAGTEDDDTVNSIVFFSRVVGGAGEVCGGGDGKVEMKMRLSQTKKVTAAKGVEWMTMTR